MGAPDGLLLRMIALQAVLVGLVGYGLGVGLASLFGFATRNSELAFLLPWELLGFTAGAIVLICVGSAVFSMWKVVRLEPAVVFKG